VGDGSRRLLTLDLSLSLGGRGVRLGFYGQETIAELQRGR